MERPGRLDAPRRSAAVGRAGARRVAGAGTVVGRGAMAALDRPRRQAGPADAAPRRILPPLRGALARRGLVRAPAQTPREFARVVASILESEKTSKYGAGHLSPAAAASMSQDRIPSSFAPPCTASSQPFIASASAAYP